MSLKLARHFLTTWSKELGWASARYRQNGVGLSVDLTFCDWSRIVVQLALAQVLFDQAGSALGSGKVGHRGYESIPVRG
jgi:hypothetical protein